MIFTKRMASLLVVNSLSRISLKALNGPNIRRFHQTCFRRVVAPKTSLKTGVKYVIGGTALVGGGGFACINYDLKSCYEQLLDLIRAKFVVQCEEFATKKTNRTAHYEETLAGSEILSSKNDSFDWAEFFRLIYQEKWYFLAATIVR